MLMKTAFALAISGFALVFAPLSTSSIANAGEQPNILIMGEDADLDTVPRNSRVFKRVLSALSTELGQVGFKVYDETGISMEFTNPGRVRRTDAELIEIAQNVQQPIDVISIFQIYASSSKSPYADILGLRMRISGRLLQVQDKRMLGNFEVSYGPKDLPPFPAKCNRDCVLEFVGDQAKLIARDVGAVLTQKLEVLSPGRTTVTAPVVEPTVVEKAPVVQKVITMESGKCTGLTTAYTLTFTGFEPSEITTVEEYIVAFKGYDHHRPVSSQLRQISYWYETCSDIARLGRNLRLMLEQIGIKGRLSQRGNRFELEKIALVKTR